jgi:hypothetical protein
VVHDVRRGHRLQGRGEREAAGGQRVHPVEVGLRLRGVPSDADSSQTPLAWSALLSRTIPAVERAAPDAKVLIVGPVAGDARVTALRPVGDVLAAYAKQTAQHYVSGVTHHWVGRQVDADQGLPTADALKSVGIGLGGEVEKLLAE